MSRDNELTIETNKPEELRDLFRGFIWLIHMAHQILEEGDLSTETAQKLVGCLEEIQRAERSLNMTLSDR